MPDLCTDLAGGIALCPSPPHRGVLGLVRAAAGIPAGGPLTQDLAASDPADLLRIAVQSCAHVVIASGFERAPDLAAALPRDLTIVFHELGAANLTRNAAIREQLAVLGGVLHRAGLRGVVLKGAAELLDPLFPNPAFRFLSDVDLLLTEAEAGAAFAALTGAGAIPRDDAARPGHHHLAPLYHPDWPVPVELHKRLGPVRHAAHLTAALHETARDAALPGLALPTPPHRLAHAVLHAQLPWRQRMGEFSLRDALEFELLTRALAPAEVAEARALFTAGNPLSKDAPWEALDAARCLVFGQTAGIDALPPPARRWAEKALTRFGQPRRRRLARLGWDLGRYGHDFLRDPDRRRHFLSQLASPGGLRRALAARRDRTRRLP
ncbi:MAG: hypothetical protein CSA74_09205 [Rhodobacterales bacterium]|nr:MAG: hypothetical protein CSA74_09205 [Rhodobacterales bacterium]